MLLECAAVLAGIAFFLPGHRRRTSGGEPPFVQRYALHILGAIAVVALVGAFRLLRPFAQPGGVLLAGQELSSVLLAADAGFRGALAAAGSEPLDVVFGLVVLVLHPTMLVLAPLLWLLADEERAAKTALASIAALLVLSVPAHFLLAVQVPQIRPFPFLGDVGALYYPVGQETSIPGTNAALAICVAFAARRSRNVPFQRLCFAYPVVTIVALLYYGLNGVAGVLTGALFAVMASVFAARVNSVERIAHHRIDASPDRKMEIHQSAEALLEALRVECQRMSLEAEPKLVGSVAKDTYLGHKVDIDAFVLFPASTARKALEDHGLALGRAVLESPEERYAEHPYLAGKWKGLDAEVVPAYKVASSAERMSAVDRTPFHTEYVVRKLEPLQRREVRLLKQFLLGIGVYGAEAKVQGFSGYLAELLVIKYGTFRRVLEAGKDWRPGQLLTLEPLEDAPSFPDALIVIDPVDASRNVASALSLENLLAFQEAARQYLKDPKLGFFFPRPVSPRPRAELRDVLHKRGHGLVALRLPRPDILEDSLHAQLRKCARAAWEELERSGFRPIASEFGADEGHAWVALELESLSINEREVHAGPPVDAKEHAERFRARWTANPRSLSPVYEEQGRLLVARRREHTNAATLLQSKALELDLGKDLTAIAKARGFAALDTAASLAELDATFLTRFLQHAKPWER